MNYDIASGFSTNDTGGFVFRNFDGTTTRLGPRGINYGARARPGGQGKNDEGGILGAIQRFINGYNEKTDGTKNDLVLVTKGKLEKQKRCKNGFKRCGKACIKKGYNCKGKKNAPKKQTEVGVGPRRA